MAEVFADRAESTLAAGIAIGAVSLTVQAGHGAKFPATGDFSVLLEKASDPAVYELVKATARAVDTITITATTLAWAAADKVVHVIDKRALDAALASKQALSDHDPFLGARVTKSVSQSINNAVETALSFDVETYDASNWHDNAVSNNRITPSRAGYVRPSGVVVFVANTTGYRWLELRKNGVVVQAVAVAPASGPTNLNFCFDPVFMNGTTDYLEIRAWQNSGGALDVVGGAANTSFAVEFLGA